MITAGNMFSVVFLPLLIGAGLVGIPIVVIAVFNSFGIRFGIGGLIVMTIGLIVPILFISGIHSDIEQSLTPATIESLHSESEVVMTNTVTIPINDTLMDIPIPEYQKANLTMDNLDSSELDLGDY